MCIGSIVRLVEIRDEAGVPVGRMEDGCLYPLAFVPDASVGAYLLLHLGIPVEVLNPEQAREALAMRLEGDDPRGNHS
jgi:hydrogenase maturation factor